MAKREHKTNAMRIADAAGIEHTVRILNAQPTMSGVEIARLAGEDPDRVFKTLVTVAKSGEHYVFMIPVAQELDLKKAAKASGEKSVEMVKSRELFDLTGYVHGGCSPLGMKKNFATLIDESCELYETIMFSGGRVGTQIEMSYQDLSRLIQIESCDLIVI